MQLTLVKESCKSLNRCTKTPICAIFSHKTENFLVVFRSEKRCLQIYFTWDKNLSHVR